MQDFSPQIASNSLDPDPTAANKKVVIIGCGIFGVSTGIHMLKKGGYDVTIIDKSAVVPAPDAASNDYNRIIRNGDYADPLMCDLNVQAVAEWVKPEWEGTFHQVGYITRADNDSETGYHKYLQDRHENLEAAGLAHRHFTDPKPMREIVLSKLSPKLSDTEKDERIGKFTGNHSLFNMMAGWAEAGRALAVGIKRFEGELGGKIMRGREVVGLMERTEAADTESGTTTVQGVILASGEKVYADLVVVAAGAWTPALFAQEGMGCLDQLVATGQSTACIQLTPEEMEEYKNMPVMLELCALLYMFPPTSEGIIKIAVHGSGYLNTINPPDPKSTNERVSQAKGISTPRTILTPGVERSAIPKEMVKQLRDGLTAVYPKLGREKPFISTRLCWYTDTPDGSWLIDWHPKKRNVLLATGGSGHAFKFFPIIGREILNRIEGTLSPELASRWRFSDRQPQDVSKAADHRHGNRKVLKLEDLATKEDLKAPGCINAVGCRS